MVAKSKKDEANLNQNLDLFLNEGELIALAIQHLKGSPPPRTLPRELPLSHSSQKTLIARELEARGWTSRDLALAAGIPPGEAAALERGTTRFTLETARIFAKIFATSEEFWLERDVLGR